MINRVMLGGLLALIASPALAQGDAAQGEAVFRKCQACHVVDQEQNRVGPYLQGVVGRAAGAVEGFNYSDAMSQAGQAGLVWNAQTIDGYLAAPRDYIPGNKMAFAGLQSEEERADVIAYLEQHSQ